MNQQSSRPQNLLEFLSAQYELNQSSQKQCKRRRDATHPSPNSRHALAEEPPHEIPGASAATASSMALANPSPITALLRLNQQLLIREREQAIGHLRALYTPQPCLPTVIPLNVSGEVFCIAARTLAAAAPESELYRMIVHKYHFDQIVAVEGGQHEATARSSIPVDHEGRLFLDHDPTSFRFLVNRLRGYGAGDTCRSCGMEALIGSKKDPAFAVPGLDNSQATSEHFSAIQMDASLLGLGHIVECGTLSIGGVDDYQTSTADTSLNLEVAEQNRTSAFDPVGHILECRRLAGGGQRAHTLHRRSMKRGREDFVDDLTSEGFLHSGGASPDVDQSSHRTSDGAAHLQSSASVDNSENVFFGGVGKPQREVLGFGLDAPCTSKSGLKLSSKLTVGAVGPPLYPENGGRHEMSFLVEDADAVGIGVISGDFTDFSDDFGTNHPGCASLYNNGKFSHMFPTFTSEQAAMRYGAGCVVTVILDFEADRLIFEVGGAGAQNYSPSSAFAEPTSTTTPAPSPISLPSRLQEPNGSPIPRFDIPHITGIRNINSPETIVAGRTVATASFALGCPRSFRFAVALMGNSSVTVAPRPSVSQANEVSAFAIQPVAAGGGDQVGRQRRDDHDGHRRHHRHDRGNHRPDNGDTSASSAFNTTIDIGQLFGATLLGNQNTSETDTRRRHQHQHHVHHQQDFQNSSTNAIGTMELRRRHIEADYEENRRGVNRPYSHGGLRNTHTRGRLFTTHQPEPTTEIIPSVA